MTANLWGLVPLGAVALFVVGDLIWAVVSERRQQNARIRADVEKWMARYRERNRQGDDQ